MAFEKQQMGNPKSIFFKRKKQQIVFQRNGKKFDLQITVKISE